MIIMFFALIIGVLSLNFFVLNFEIQGLNRTIIDTPMEMLYTAIIPDPNTPKFNTRSFELKVISYYNKELSKYVDNYDASFYYYNLENHGYCDSRGCPAVEITVTSSLSFNYQYRRVMFYELRINDNG